MALNVLKSCDPGQTVEIVFRDAVKVSVNDQAMIAIPLTERKSLRFDSALLSAQNNTITLRNRNNRVPTNITAAEGIGTIRLRIRQNSQVQEQEIRDVQKISIIDTEIDVAYSARDSQAASTSSGSNSSTPDSTQKPSTRQEVVQLEREKEKLKQQLAKATEIMNGLRTSVKALTDENSNLRTENAGLNRAVAAGLDQIIADSRSGQLSLSPILQQKLEELDQLQREASDTNSRIEQVLHQVETQSEANAATVCHLQELQDQLSTLRGQKEIMDLDCGRVSEELVALRTRLQMDGDIVALTESRWLKNNSVNDTMKELEKKISAVEDRIGFILKARELYGHAVQSAVLLGGDGTISANDESGKAAQEPYEDSGNTDTTI